MNPGDQCIASEFDAEGLDNLQDWIQCDKCDMWRKVGRGVILKETDPWFCSLNIWKPELAFCGADQESDDDYDNVDDDGDDKEEAEDEGGGG